MSNKKPRIYGHCDAGCRWETVHKSDFVRAVQYVEIPMPDDKIIELEVGNKYKIYSAKIITSTFFALPDVYIGTEQKLKLTGVGDPYRNYYYMEILAAEYTADSSSSTLGKLNIVYEFDGERKTATIENVIVGSNYKIQVENANKVFLYNKDAVELIGANGEDGKDGADGADGKSAYDIAVENGYSGTEQQFGAALVKAAGSTGWTDEQITLLETILANIAYTDASTGQTAADSLIASLRNSSKTLTGISVTYTGGTVSAGTTLDQLTGITVTATYSDGTEADVADYTLSGTLTAGQDNTITVTYKGLTDTFTVSVSEKTLTGITANYTGGTVPAGTTLDGLKDKTIVVANYSDDTTEVVTEYTLSGTLTAGQSNTITATYQGKTATFSVTVSSTGSTSYMVTYNLTNCSSSNTADSVEAGKSFVATIMANTGYDISAVTVTMGGADITSTAFSGGIVSIDNVTGDIVITATATASTVTGESTTATCAGEDSSSVEYIPYGSNTLAFEEPLTLQPEKVTISVDESDKLKKNLNIVEATLTCDNGTWAADVTYGTGSSYGSTTNKTVEIEFTTDSDGKYTGISKLTIYYGSGSTDKYFWRCAYYHFVIYSGDLAV